MTLLLDADRCLQSDGTNSRLQADGQSALMLASLRGDLTCAGMLLVAGADPNLTTDSGAHALICAALQDSREACMYMGSLSFVAALQFLAG